MFEANLFCTDYFNWETNRASRADAPIVLRVRRSSLNDILAPESGWKEHFRADALKILARRLEDDDYSRERYRENLGWSEARTDTTTKRSVLFFFTWMGSA